MGVQKWLHERDLKKRIARHGWTTVHVAEGGVDPCFAYTVALGKSPNDAELILFGLPPEFAQQVLEHAVEKLAIGELKLVDGARWDQGPEDVRYVLRRVHRSHHESGHFGSALWWRRTHMNTDRFDAFQVVGFDRNGRLPWEAECAFGSRMTQKPLYEPLEEADPDGWYFRIEKAWKAAGEPELSSASCG